MPAVPLSLFLQSLFTSGTVAIEGRLALFEEADTVQCLQLLTNFYKEDVLHMPAPAPAFNEDAALWAARLLYTTLQLTVIREIAEEKIATHLPDFSGSRTPETIYSADLVLRYLPDVFGLAKGLAPGDVMVKYFLQTAVQWPFSSVGMPLNSAPDDTAILQHPCLRIAYADRIIQMKDLHRAQANAGVQEAVQEALGNHAGLLWPQLHLQTT